MNKRFIKILTIIIICLFIIGGFNVSVLILGMNKNAVNDAKNAINNVCQRQAQEFNKQFSNFEFITDSMSAVVCREFTVAEYKNNRRLFESHKREMSYIINDVISSSQFPMGIYITFDPESSQGWDEIWYEKNHHGEVFSINSPAVSQEWLYSESEVNEYYFRAIRESAFWSGITYDFYLDEDIISYAKPAYDINNDLIGVVGIDILVEDINDTLLSIDDEINGYSAIISSSGKELVGTVTSDMLNSDEYITSTSTINDSYRLVLVQSVDSVVKTVYKKVNTLAAICILIFLLIICIVVMISTKKVRPILREYEQKDLLIINQSRQVQLGEMIGSIVHQWKQPLNIMKMSVSNLQDDYERDILDEEAFYRYTDRIHEMINNLSDTADDFRDFLRPHHSPEKFSVLDEIKTVIRLTEEQMKTKSIRIDITGTDFKVTGYKNEFNQCIFNLLDNARDALMEAPSESRCIRIHISDDRCISIENNGSHIDDAICNSLFDLYFTTKSDTGGTGVGLYITRKIIEDHFHGNIFYENTDSGVRFIMKFDTEEK